ncbi:MAG: Putative protein-S-isoprenylcysteine methyltransferase, partial [uncultured Rubrobacteraceae bacterium]
ERRKRYSEQRGCDRPSASDLRRSARRGTAGKGTVSGYLPAAWNHAGARRPADRSRPTAVHLQPPRSASRGDGRENLQADDKPRDRRSLPLHAQPHLPGLHAGVWRNYRSRQLALERPAPPLRPHRHAARGDPTRRALPGARLRRGVPPVQSSGATLDL